MGQLGALRYGRVVAIVAAVALASLIAAGSASAYRVPRVQPLAKLKRSVTVRVAPRLNARKVSVLARRRPITGSRTVVPVLNRTRRSGRLWVRVRLPGRPNGRTGWIPAGSARLGATHWHIVVHTAIRRAQAYWAGHWVRTFKVIVGKPSTPTPHGEFFVEESVIEPASFPGAPYALATSARSNVLQEFDGGPGQIALHGIRNIGGRLGTAASHGCVRFSTAAISWLARQIGAGTPVTIRN